MFFVFYINVYFIEIRLVIMKKINCSENKFII